MTNMDIAVNSLHDAVKFGKRILLYGDYDVDGLCSLLIMRQFFDLINVKHYDIVKYKTRTHHISPDVVNDALSKGSELTIIMDTGSGEPDLEELSRLIKVSNVIVCDHHTPQFDYSTIDRCVFLNPKHLDQFPYLSGACVVYELCLNYFVTYRSDEVAVAKKYLSFLACAALYSDSIYNDNSYTKTLYSHSQRGIFPQSVAFLPYIHSSKRFFLYTFAPLFNACFRNGRLDLINNLLLGDIFLTYADKDRYVKDIIKLRDYSREVVIAITKLCQSTVYNNIVFTDLTGLLNQNIPNRYIKDNKGLIANMLAAKYKMCSMVVVSDGTQYLLSVRDYHNRDVFRLCRPFYKVGGHPPAFGGSMTNKDRLEIEDKLKFFDTKLTETHKPNIIPFSYNAIDKVARDNEYKQQKDIVLMRVPYSEVKEEWSPETFSERFLQFKLNSTSIWWRKEPWYRMGEDMLVHFYVTTKIKADMVQEDA